MSAAVIWVPLVARLPLQPPEPAQAVAPVEFHVNVVVAPLATEVVVALRDAVGAAGSTFWPSLQAARSTKSASQTV